MQVNSVELRVRVKVESVQRVNIVATFNNCNLIAVQILLQRLILTGDMLK